MLVLAEAWAGAGDVVVAAVGDATACGSINVGRVVKAKSRLSVYPDCRNHVRCPSLCIHPHTYTQQILLSRHSHLQHGMVL